MNDTIINSTPENQTEKRFGFWKTIFLTFFSKDVYQDIAENREGSGSLYLLTLSFLATSIAALILIFVFIFVVPLNTLINEGLEEGAEIIMPQLPETMEIREGEMILPKSEPYFIQYEGQTFMVMDTSGEYSVDDLNENLMAVITKDYFAFYNSNDKKTELARFKDFCDESPELCNTGELTKEELYQLIKEGIQAISPYIPVILIIIGLITALFFSLFIFVYHFIQALLFSLVSLLLSSIVKVHLKYNDLLRITIFAMTPMIIINIILTCLAIQYSGFIFFGVVTAYLVFALTSLKQKIPPKGENI